MTLKLAKAQKIRKQNKLRHLLQFLQRRHMPIVCLCLNYFLIKNCIVSIAKFAGDLVREVSLSHPVKSANIRFVWTFDLRQNRLKEQCVLIYAYQCCKNNTKNCIKPQLLGCFWAHWNFVFLPQLQRPLAKGRFSINVYLKKMRIANIFHLPPWEAM